MSENDVLLTIVRIRFFVKKPLFLGVLRGFVTSKVLSFVVAGELLIWVLSDRAVAGELEI